MIWYDWGHRPDDVIGPNAPEADRRIHTPNDLSRTCLPVNMAEKYNVYERSRLPFVPEHCDRLRNPSLRAPAEPSIRESAHLRIARGWSCWTTWKSIPRKGSLTGRWVFLPTRAFSLLRHWCSRRSRWRQ